MPSASALAAAIWSELSARAATSMPGRRRRASACAGPMKPAPTIPALIDFMPEILWGSLRAVKFAAQIEYEEKPPSMGISAPVTKREASDSSQITAPSSSSGSP